MRQGRLRLSARPKLIWQVLKFAFRAVSELLNPAASTFRPELRGNLYRDLSLTLSPTLYRF